MPLPTPSKEEDKDKFISRCMGNTNMNKEFPDNKQRVAVCYSIFKRKDEAKESVEKLSKLESKLEKVEQLEDIQNDTNI